MSATLHTLQRHLDKRARAWRRFIDRTTELARIAHPATGGNEMLCHNWGNDAAREIWARGWRRWNAYAARSEAVTRGLMLAHVNGSVAL